MTEQQQSQQDPPKQEAPKPEAPKGGNEKQPPWGKPENFDPDKAWELIQNLRNEKGDPNLRTELEQLRQASEQQRTALAAALGVKPEEASDVEKLNQRINSMQDQVLASERRALSAEFRVPETMLTATDAAEMRKQAEALVEFAQASHYAAITAQPTPQFQQNPGQGQGNAPLTPEAQQAAEYEKYYPPIKR